MVDYKIAICDDEEETLSYISNLVTEAFYKSGVRVNINRITY